MPESRLSAKSYLLVAAALLALTALTYAAAMLDLGSWNTVIALAILMVGQLNDVVTRGWLHVPGR